MFWFVRLSAVSKTKKNQERQNVENSDFGEIIIFIYIAVEALF
jgi:hypothetical protein